MQFCLLRWLATQLAIVEAYLANVPKAEVELVLVGRAAQRLFGRLVPATEVAPALPAGLAQRPLGNGSFLDRGAAVAAELLARDGRPGRVVLFTDDQMRAAFDVKDVAATLGRAPRGTIVDAIYPVSRDWVGVSQIGWDRPMQIASALGGGYYRVTVRKPPVPGDPQLAAKLRSLLVPDSIQEIVMESARRLAAAAPAADGQRSRHRPTRSWRFRSRVVTTSHAVARPRRSGPSRCRRSSTRTTRSARPMRSCCKPQRPERALRSAASTRLDSRGGESGRRAVCLPVIGT